MFKWPGGPRKTFPEVRGLKYQFVYLKIRIFRCSHRMTYVYIYILYVFTGMHISMNYNDLILTSLEGLDSKGISNPNRIVQQQLSGW